MSQKKKLIGFTIDWAKQRVGEQQRGDRRCSTSRSDRIVKKSSGYAPEQGKLGYHVSPHLVGPRKVPQLKDLSDKGGRKSDTMDFWRAH